MAVKDVAVLGASNKPDRYSNKAVRMLIQHGYRVIPVHPALTEVEGLPVAASLSEVNRPLDTLTVYVGPARILSMIDSIVDLNPGRVILNPGTESEELKQRLDRAAIRYVEACTLVLLRTGQFDTV